MRLRKACRPCCFEIAGRSGTRSAEVWALQMRCHKKPYNEASCMCHIMGMALPSSISSTSPPRSIYRLHLQIGGHPCLKSFNPIERKALNRDQPAGLAAHLPG